MYNLDEKADGVSECPKCRFSMEPLRRSSQLDLRSGYLLDTGTGWDPDDHVVTSYLFGSLTRFFWRYFLEPLGSKTIGEWRSRRLRRILRDYPRSLICTHCHYVLRRK